MASSAGAYPGRRPCRNHPPSALAAFRTKVNDPVRTTNHINIMLDNHHGVPGSHELLKHGEQNPDIIKMQARRRLIKKKKNAPGHGQSAPNAGKVAGKFQAL